MTDIDIIVAVGKEMRRRGRDWRHYCDSLRALYFHLRRGTTPNDRSEEWSLKHGIDFANMMGLGPEPWPIRPSYSKCAVCPPDAKGPSYMQGRRTFSAGVLPDRSGVRCLVCDRRWIEASSNFQFSPGDARANAGHPRGRERTAQRAADRRLAEAEQRHVA